MDYPGKELTQIRKKLQKLISDLYPEIILGKNAITISTYGFKIEFPDGAGYDSNKIINIEKLLKTRRALFFKPVSSEDLSGGLNVFLFENTPYIRFDPSQPVDKVLRGLDELIKLTNNRKKRGNFVDGVDPIAIDLKTALETHENLSWLKRNQQKYDCTPEDTVTTYLLRKTRKEFPGNKIGVTHAHNDAFTINFMDVDITENTKREIYDFVEMLEKMFGNDAVHIASLSNNGRMAITITGDTEVLKDKITTNGHELLLENRVTLLR